MEKLKLTFLLFFFLWPSAQKEKYESTVDIETFSDWKIWRLLRLRLAETDQNVVTVTFSRVSLISAQAMLLLLILVTLLLFTPAMILLLTTSMLLAYRSHATLAYNSQAMFWLPSCDRSCHVTGTYTTPVSYQVVYWRHDTINTQEIVG